MIATVVDAEHARKLLADMLVSYRIEGRLRTAAEFAGATHRESGEREILLVNRYELEHADGRARVVEAISRLVALPEAGYSRVRMTTDAGAREFRG